MIPTPHIDAKTKAEIADTVLMPGDPLRAKYVAETFLEKAVQYNATRGMLGYTGIYKGKRVSVQGSGMGMPSIGIYSYELFNFYDVKNIIRIGSAGSMSADLKVRDIVIAQGACTDSNYSSQFRLPGAFAPIASYELLERAVNSVKARGIRHTVGNVLSADVFYNANPDVTAKWQSMDVLAVEMESAALYMNAAYAKKRALCILTISDELLSGVATTAQERQTSFTEMMEIALETAI